MIKRALREQATEPARVAYSWAIVAPTSLLFSRGRLLKVMKSADGGVSARGAASRRPQQKRGARAWLHDDRVDVACVMRRQSEASLSVWKCPHRRRPQFAATVFMQTSESHPSASLALLFRGDAFRAGLHFHRTGALAAANPEPQLLAMASHIQHVVRPAAQLGWRLATLFDVVIPPRFEAKFDQASRPLNILAKRIVYVRKAPNQMTSVVNSLEWALPLLEGRAGTLQGDAHAAN